MTQEVKLPELGENIEAAEVANVLVSEGDKVAVDQPLIEIETDKASMEIPSPVGGRVVEVLVAVGDSVPVGQAIVRLEDVTEAGDADEEEARAEAPPEAETEDEPEPEPEAPPAPDERPARPEGPTPDVAPLADPVPAAPSVRRLARELGVEIAAVSGSGTGGRISMEDVKGHARAVVTSGPAAAAEAGPVELPDLSAFGPIEREPVSKVRRVTAENMARSWSRIPHVTQHDRADVTDMEAFRKQYGPRVASEGVKLTPTALAIKVAAEALRAFPKFNASLDLANDEIVYRRYVHIGVAVDTDRGLLVPVLRDADRKTITQIARELDDLAGRARSKKLTPDEMAGAGFTVSNLGGLGTTDFSPIVTWPQVAVLGVGRASTQAVWSDDRFEPRLIMPLSLSYDHRLIDGAEAARFLRWLAEAMEQPWLMFLGGKP